MTKHLAATRVSTTPIRTLKTRPQKAIERHPPMTSIYEFTFETIASSTTTMNVNKYSASTTKTQRPSPSLPTTTTASALSSAVSVQTIITTTSTSETFLSTTSPLVTVKTVNEAFRNKKETESSGKTNNFIAGAIITGLVLITLVSGCVAIVTFRNACTCMKVSPSADTAN